MLNLTTWPASPAPFASFTTAVTVAGVVLLTDVVDSVTEIDGPLVDVAPPDGETWKPIVCVNAFVPTVAFATTRSAPFEFPDAGVSLTTALPAESVKAEPALNAPSPPDVLNVTTWPAMPVPDASFSDAVTVAGVVKLAVVLEVDSSSDGVGRRRRARRAPRHERRRAGAAATAAARHQPQTEQERACQLNESHGKPRRNLRRSK